MPSVFFETYGCQMNVADSGALAELLAGEGYSAASDPRSADLLIVNTCSVREHAEKRALARITEFANVKAKRRTGQQLWVVGCMAQRLGDALRQQIPGVDRVIGAIEFETIRDHIRDYLSAASAASVQQREHPGVSCFVPIMRGCNNYCSYCIVPYVRGREHSLPADAICREVADLVRRGAKEVTLLGQNVNSYADPAGHTDFPALLRRIHDTEGLERIRFTTSHPKDCGEQLIRTVAELPKLCKHVHLPVQSGSTRILAAMNRRYSRDDYMRITELIRSAMPDGDITTDVMTGFPGETDADYRETLSLIETVRFTSAFMFAFSPREQTSAARLDDQVPHKLAKERLEELIELQTSITKEHYAAMVGREVAVLLTARQDGPDAMWMGQDHGCKRVLVACDGQLAGTILPTVVTASSGMTLLCKGRTACVS